MAERRKRKLEYNRQWVRAERLNKRCKEENDLEVQEHCEGNETVPDSDYFNDNDYLYLESLERDNNTVEETLYLESLERDNNTVEETLYLESLESDNNTVEETLSDHIVNHSEIENYSSTEENGEVENLDQNEGILDNDYISDNEVVPEIQSSSDSESEHEEEHDIRSKLVEWVNKHSVKHNAVDSLLKLVNAQFDTNLPNSARTLLKTARHVDVRNVSGMEYIYFGFRDQLVLNLNRYPENIRLGLEESIPISLNIDGLPLFKSSNKSVWPVLCSINIEPVVVFPIVLTIGKSKPENLDFLTDVMNELNHIQENGVEYEERHFIVDLKCIVCDAPAKSFVKGIKQYSGYYGCDRCDQKGVWEDGRVTYQQIHNLSPRTDHTFRNRQQEEHHNNDTPFCDLNIDMINGFPLDYMHQVCLGVMRKLLGLWTKGGNASRLSARQITQINTRILGLREAIPSIFARKPRGLNEIDRWKATEFRQFLLYTGKIVLKDILKPEHYRHFLVLNVAIGILINPTLKQEHSQYAHQLLEYFVEEGSILYGLKFLVYNVHSLLHLRDSAQDFRSLDSCSAFAFENYMQVIKKQVRSGKKPIVQIAKRMQEMQDMNINCERKKKKCKKPNNVFFIRDSMRVCEIINKTRETDANGDQKNLCRVYLNLRNLFNQPCDSELIGVLEGAKRQTRIRVLPNEALRRQAILLEKDNNTAIFMAILHNF